MFEVSWFSAGSLVQSSSFSVRFCCLETLFTFSGDFAPYFSSFFRRPFVSRLLADLPLTVERERELRSIFLNDPSTPEEHNLTLRYLTASQSGDKQTLRELRHQILARRSRRHPPVDAIPGLDVTPLREHAWLDSLADDGVKMSTDFYDRLQEFAAPNPPVVNLGDDSDSIATIMARDDTSEAVYLRRTGASAGVSNLLAPPATVTSSSRPTETAADQGSNALWLPEDASAGPLTVEVDGPWREDALDLAYPRVARDLYHMPSGYRLVVPLEEAIVTECPPGHVAVYTHHFEFGLRFPLDSFLVEILNVFNVCLAQLTPLAVRDIIAYIWVVCFLDFPQTVNLFRHIHWLKRNGSSRQSGFDNLHLDMLCVDEDLRPLTNLPPAPANDYETMHGVTNGRRGGNRHGPQNIRRGRGGVVTSRVPTVGTAAAASTSVPLSPAIPLLSSTNQTVTRGGVTRRQPREQIPALLLPIKALELIEQYLEYQRLADTYKVSLETCQGLLKDAEDELKPLKDEVETLRERAILLEETEENVKALTKTVETANTEKEVVVLDASAEAKARGVAKGLKLCEYLCFSKSVGIINNIQLATSDLIPNFSQIKSPK
ncbi:hypothetical protein BVRB_6g141330 [Beta vulgaris subsp. vulgaris]|nr:hypothetical protein BVRB_6g141330 [Beta vulgaris subsp. vulgaris]